MKKATWPAGLLLIDDAAKFLGVSTGTFRRIIKRTGLKPAPLARLKPQLFYESDLSRLKNPTPLVQDNDDSGVLSMAEIKRRAKRNGGRK